MNYFAKYDQLIASCKASKPQGYTEKHHILPRSMGGSDSADNLVDLTPKAHFLAHRLLAKMYGGRMWAALAYMSRGNTKSAKGVHITSRVYDLAAREDAAWRSEYYSKNNPFRGKKHSAKTCAALRGPRPAIAGANHPRWGKKDNDIGAVISFVQTYKPRDVEVDLRLRDFLDRTLVHASPELKRLCERYRRSAAMTGVARRLTGESNPNYGNGQAIRGEKNPMYGKIHLESTREKIAEKARRKVCCPNCGKVGSISNMKRWHFDNCRNPRDKTITPPV